MVKSVEARLAAQSKAAAEKEAALVAKIAALEARLKRAAGDPTSTEGRPKRARRAPH